MGWAGSALRYLSYVIQAGDFRAQTSVHTQELLVEESRQRQAVERIHTGIIYTLRVLYFTCRTDGETDGGQITEHVEHAAPPPLSKGCLKTNRVTALWRPEQQDLHSCLKVKYSVRCRHSWLPLRRKRVLGWLIFRAHRYSTHCRETHSESTHHFKHQTIPLRAPRYIDTVWYETKCDLQILIINIE